MSKYLILLSSFIVAVLPAQDITIQPYLQQASPNELYILWETDSGEESIVEWGTTEDLGQETTGISYPSNGDFRVHEVHLTDLERFTTYYYRVRTDTAASAIFSCKTPPFASDEQSFRIVAMSDMQRDNSEPDKFREVVEDGVIQYLEDQFGGELADNLALVMIPGDLVVTGTNFDQWRNHFFNPSEKLFSYVPLYPVLGNHEYNASFYFTYFKLPENGSVGFEEQWWHHDYGNVRIIGLDSNGPFASPEQLSWLDTVLQQTCAADSIDFVFAQLHHPHKSELWTPGESDFTGEVIARLEEFSTDCGKPGIHFFGHTHGYSRGQSRDHKHLWINVATAGGAIDNWGEFPNFDYDEFSVSQDEYGFVVVDVTAGENPSVTVRRISRGDQDVTIENSLTDSLTIYRNSKTVHIPEPVRPNLEVIAPECVILQAEDFSTEDINLFHAQSHWQVATSPIAFDQPVAERWRNFENWYYDENTQAGDDLTDEKIEGLNEYTAYWWRVRYRDNELNWSDWSDPLTFTTGASIALPNVLSNSGAEDDLTGWEISEGVVESLESNVCQGVPAHSGNRYFAVGGLCEHSPVGRAFQDVDVSSWADSIDAGFFAALYGGWLSNYSGSDLPEMKIQFLDVMDQLLAESEKLSTLNNSWTLLSDTLGIPLGTRTIRMELTGTRNVGTDNDSYFDDLFLRIGRPGDGCDESVPTGTQSFQPTVSSLHVAPNPMEQTTRIYIPGFYQDQEVILAMTGLDGRKVIPEYDREADYLLLKRGSLTPGIYMVWLRTREAVIGTGKIVVGGY